MKKQPTTFNQLITRSLLFTVLISILFLIIFLLAIGLQSVSKHADQDSLSDSNIIFQSLQTQMNYGANAEDLQGYLEQIASLQTDKNIQLQTEGFEIITEPTIRYSQDYITSYHPFKAEQSCLQCHTQDTIGEQKALLIHQYPIATLALNLIDVLSLITLFSLTSFLIIFATLFISFKRKVLQPIERFTEQLTQINSHADLNRLEEVNTIHEIEVIQKEFNRLSQILHIGFNNLHKESVTDPLTDLLNRRSFDQIIEQEMNQVQQQSCQLTLFVLDLNHFKEINDQYGHVVGDKVLQYFARMLQQSTKERDYLFRSGGDEFLLLIKGSTAKTKETVIRRMFKNLSGIPFQVDDKLTLRLSSSIGFATFPQEAQTASELLELADQRMYQHKNKLRQTEASSDKPS